MTFLQQPPRENAPEIVLVQDNSGVLDHEADHRIANNLSLIISLLRLRSRTVAQGRGKMDRAEVGLLLEDIAARVETVAKLHRMLSHSSRQAQVGIGGYLRELCASLASSLAPQTRVDLSHQIDDGCTMRPDQVLALGMLISELVTNSVKYAHPTGLPVKIDISCRQSDTGGLVIDFADDGIGLPENFNALADGGLGLRMVRSLAAQLGGFATFKSDSLGTQVRLELPASD